MSKRQNAGVDRTLLEKQKSRKQAVGLGLMSLGSLLGLLGFWVFVEHGGSLINQPSIAWYWYGLPSIASGVLCLFGWIKVMP